MYILPFRVCFAVIKRRQNGIMIASVFFLVKSVDRSDKKYALVWINVKPDFSFQREYDTIKGK